MYRKMSLPERKNDRLMTCVKKALRRVPPTSINHPPNQPGASKQGQGQASHLTSITFSLQNRLIFHKKRSNLDRDRYLTAVPTRIEVV